ncbi:hypothetical protein J3Q00_12040 [Pseudomonas sp. D2-3]
MIGAGVGTAAGAVAGKVVKDSMPNSMPSSLKENISVIFGAAASEGVGPLLIVEEKKGEK